jgi:hypothetical protein
VGINQGSTDRDARQRNPVALCCSHSPTEPALHNDALHNDAVHNDAVHNDAVHNDALHNDALHNDALHIFCVAQ